MSHFQCDKQIEENYKAMPKAELSQLYLRRIFDEFDEDSSYAETINRQTQKTR